MAEETVPVPSENGASNESSDSGGSAGNASDDDGVTPVEHDEPKGAPRACGHPTREGRPCSRAPLAGAGGRCHNHAGLESTEAQRAASRRNPVTHGWLVRTFRNDDHRELYERVAGREVGPEELRQQALAALAVRVARIVEWENQNNKTSPLTERALKQLLKALPEPPPEPQTPAPSSATDHVELVRRVEAILEENPEVLVQRLPPSVQDAVRAAMREEKGS